MRHDPEALVQRLVSPPFVADPYPVFNRLREVAPMHRSELGFWCASDHRSCAEVYRSSRLGLGFGAARLEQDPRYAESLSLQTFGHMLPFIDPPDHTRIRRLLAPYFTPKNIDGMRHYTEELVDRLLDGLAEAGGGDLVADFAEDIPVAVACQLLGGMGESDQDQCRDWAEGLVEAVHPVVTDEMMRHADEAAEGFRAYFLGLVAANDGSGRDLMSQLIAEQRAGVIDTDELLATATTLVGAAYHNTRNHIATGIWTLLRHPDQLARLRDDPGKARAAVEELLRFEPPVQLSLPRVALEDLSMGGVAVRAGEQVCAFLGGANRDPARYAEPDRFDIDRRDGGSLALASGIHSCIGAAMARMEGEIAIGAFFERFSHVELVDEEPTLDEPGLPLTRGFTEVRVEVAV